MKSNTSFACPGNPQCTDWQIKECKHLTDLLKMPAHRNVNTSYLSEITPDHMSSEHFIDYLDYHDSTEQESWFEPLAIKYEDWITTLASQGVTGEIAEIYTMRERDDLSWQEISIRFSKSNHSYAQRQYKKAKDILFKIHNGAT